MDDETVSVFSKEQGVAEFNFGSAFSSDEDFRISLVDANPDRSPEDVQLSKFTMRLGRFW